MSLKTKTLSILMLIFVDQIIKIVIYHCFFYIKFNIIPSLLYFYPKFNTKYSYLDGLFNLNIGLFIHVIFTLVLLIIILFIFNYWRKKYRTKLLDFSFIFFIAGYICVLIGYFWKKGELDYIYLKPLFIFDLKDLYISCFVVLMLLHVIKAIIYQSNCDKKSKELLP